MTANETNKDVAISISKASISKFVDDIASDKSVDKEMHLAVLPVIKEVI